MTQEERDQLRRRVERTFGSTPVGEAIGPVRAIVGPRMPGGQEAAELARTKLYNGDEPTPKERAALEVMIRLLRPALLCRGTVFDDLSANNQYAADLRTLWTNFRALIGPLAFSAGRVDAQDGRALGTAFLVASNRIMTNDHVLDALSYGTFEIERGQGTVHFQWRWEPANTEGPVMITRVVAHDAVLDVALLEIDPPAGFAHQPFEFATADPVAGDYVAVVGYPMRDRNNRNPAFTDQLFEGKYDVKRAAPGEIVRTQAPVAFHDCSTLGGNSGSPVLSLRSAKIVGLHRSGEFMYRNEAVQMSALRQFLDVADH
jgi:V8-like Glu-specific endopeptidase